MRRFNVITDRCVRDMLCVDACLRDAIHPGCGDARFPETAQLFINPRRCIGCGACINACQHDAIFEFEELTPRLQHFAQLNAAFYRS